MWIFFFLFMCYEVGKRFESLANYLLFAVLVSSFPKTAITASSNGLPRLYLADWDSNKLSNFLKINFLEIYLGTKKKKKIEWASAQIIQLHCQINQITNQKSKKKTVQEYLSTLTNFRSTIKKL